jgi:hypothetical protein
MTLSIMAQESSILKFDYCSVNKYQNEEWVKTEDIQDNFTFSLLDEDNPAIKYYMNGDLKASYYTLKCCTSETADNGVHYNYGSYLDHNGDECKIAIYNDGSLFVIYSKMNISFLFNNGK